MTTVHSAESTGTAVTLAGSNALSARVVAQKSSRSVGSEMAGE